MARYNIHSTKPLKLSVLQEVRSSPLYSKFRFLERTPGALWVDAPHELFHLLVEKDETTAIEGEYLPSSTLIEFFQSAAGTVDLHLTYDRKSQDDFVERCLLWKRMREMQRATQISAMRAYPATGDEKPPSINLELWEHRLSELITSGYLIIV